MKIIECNVRTEEVRGNTSFRSNSISSAGIQKIPEKAGKNAGIWNCILLTFGKLDKDALDCDEVLESKKRDFEPIRGL